MRDVLENPGFLGQKLVTVKPHQQWEPTCHFQLQACVRQRFQHHRAVTAKSQNAMDFTQTKSKTNKKLTHGYIRDLVRISILYPCQIVALLFKFI